MQRGRICEAHRRLSQASKSLLKHGSKHLGIGVVAKSGVSLIFRKPLRAEGWWCQSI
jgi:hypothetical protein